MTKVDPKAAAGRAFVRSLNILLKFARLYGYEHARTIEQLQIGMAGAAQPLFLGDRQRDAAWSDEIRNFCWMACLWKVRQLKSSFAQLLSAAGLASIQSFSRQ